MASMPGILTDWPWKPLGSFKYIVLAPWAIRSTYCFCVKEKSERDVVTFLILPFLLFRMLHNQIWITLSRYRTAKGASRIVDKGLEFDQVDRERNWDDQIILNGLLYYIVTYSVAGITEIPLWRTDGVVMMMVLHAGPVEFLYYWLHRALHHHYLYSRYHSHHHSSIVTEPITSVIHPFAEHIAYFMLFAIPLLTVTLVTRTASMAGIFGYIAYIDFMNNMGHCNFELIPMWLFRIFPPLKYLMYTPSFHSLHHTKFRTNYSLFMPFYDYIYGTMDKSSDELHEFVLKRKEESPNVVHLTHFTTLDSIYHLRVGFASLASKPHTSLWYLPLMWPATLWSLMLTLVYGKTFTVETNRFKKLGIQTWVIPKYKVQYSKQGQNKPINKLIEEAILDGERKGAKVVSLGLMNQSEELNAHGGLFISKYPKLKVKVVDGSSLAVAVVLNSIPTGTTQVLFKGTLTKVACVTAFALCQKGIQVATMHQDEFMKLEKLAKAKSGEYDLVISESYSQRIWLVGEDITKEEQLKAPKGTSFIPYSKFPPKKYRKDCFYHNTPSMITPISLENVHSCENWLPRRVMSAWRIAGIVHALEGWNEHECGNTILDIHKVWQAALLHGFQPLTSQNHSN